MELQNIKQTAIYLRKSRDDSNGEYDVLEKHEKELRDLAEQLNLTYIIYKEVGSADSIEYRPEMKKLLHDVQDGLFDAILVIDYDRLGRGDWEDQGKIRRALTESQTLVITPTKVYDLNNESDDLLTDVQALMARQEYKFIKKRLQRGKKIGARLGKWTNGKPPFPYYYDRDNKKLEVDSEKLKYYELIKERFLSGVNCYSIAVELNKIGLKSPGGKYWTETAVYRLLTSEVHLGRIVYGKTQGSGHKNRNTKPLAKKPRDEWIVVENAHTPVKTEEEHSQILALLQRRKLVHEKTRRGTYILSGLVFCGKCGYSMQFVRQNNKTLGIKKCQKGDHFGNSCGNRGVSVNTVLNILVYKLNQYEQELLNLSLQEEENGEEKRLNNLLQTKQNEIKKLDQAINRLDDLYLFGRYTKDQYKSKLDELNHQINDKQTEIENIRQSMGYYNTLNREEKLRRIQKLKEILNDPNAEPKQQNRIAKQIINKIYYTREGNDINIKVEFL